MHSGRWLGAALLVAALALAGCGQRRSMAVVDTDRILNESVAALRYQRQLDDKEREYAIELDLLAPRVSQKDLETERNSRLQELARLKQDYERRLNDDLRRAAREVAAARNITLVLVKASAPYGGTDITQDVIDRMR